MHAGIDMATVADSMHPTGMHYLHCASLWANYGGFTLPDTEADEKIGYIELRGGSHTAQRQTLTMVTIGFCAHLSYLYLSLSRCRAV